MVRFFVSISDSTLVRLVIYTTGKVGLNMANDDDGVKLNGPKDLAGGFSVKLYPICSLHRTVLSGETSIGFMRMSGIRYGAQLRSVDDANGKLDADALCCIFRPCLPEAVLGDDCNNG